MGSKQTLVTGKIYINKNKCNVMCNLNRRTLNEGNYCAKGCPKCNPIGEDQYRYIITTNKDGLDKWYNMCTTCGFESPDNQPLQYHDL
mgnify:CR=1 FL=1